MIRPSRGHYCGSPAHLLNRRAFLGTAAGALVGGTAGLNVLGTPALAGELKQDYKRADYWYRKAAEQGNTEAQYRLALIWGAGGDGFPTSVKLNTQVPQLLVNGAECEPLLHKDKELLMHHADDMLRGIRISMSLAGCTEAVIGRSV